MKKTIQILAVLFVVQIGLAVWMNYPGNAGIQGQSVKLVTAKAQDIDHLTIEDGNGTKTVLMKSKDGWVLPDKDNFPADSKKVEDLVGKLTSLHEGLPIATSDGAVKRFSLADDKFERRLTFSKGQKVLDTIYLGTAQGANQIHARRKGQDSVYAVAFGAYQVPSDPNDWINANILRQQPDQVSGLDINGLKLVAEHGNENAKAKAISDAAKASPDSAKKGDTSAITGWKLADASLAGGKTLDQHNVMTLIERIETLRVSSVLGKSAKPEYGLDQPLLRFVLQEKGKGAITYQIAKMKDKRAYVLKVSSRPEYFGLGNYGAEQLIKAASPDQLLPAPKKDNPNVAAAKPDGSKPVAGAKDMSSVQ